MRSTTAQKPDLSKTPIEPREQDLKENSVQYEALVETIPLGIFEIDIQGKILFCNGAGASLVGYSVQEMIKKNIAEFLVSNEAVFHFHHYLEKMFHDQPSPDPYYTSVKTGDDSIIDVQVTWNYKRDVHGNITGFVFSVADITENKRIKKDLRKSEATLQSIFAASPVGIALLTPERMTNWINDKMVSIIGYTAEDMKSMGTRALYPDDEEFARVGEVVYGEVRRGNIGTTDTRWVHKNGRMLDIHVSAAAIDPKDLSAGIVFTAVDITERKEAEKRLVESEERYRTAIESSNDGVALVQGTTHTYVNKKFLEIFGYDRPEEITGKPTYLDVHPDDRPMVAEYNRKRQNNEDVPSRYEFKGIKKDGTILIIEVSAAGILFRGKPASLAFLRDITERRKTEEALRASEERFRTLVETTSDMVWEVDRQARYTYVSPKIRDILGYEPHEVIGKKTLDFMPPEEAERVAPILRELAGAGKPIKQLENINLHKKGWPVIFETSGEPVYDRGGVLAGYRGIDRDISERKLTEGALRQSEEKYRSVVENSLVGFCIVQDGLFRFVNKGFCEMHGYTYEEVVDKMGPADTVGEDREMVQENIRKRISGEMHNIEYELRAARKDGQIITLKVFGSTILYNGRPASIATIVDITREKILELQLLHAQKMEAIGTLAGGVAHDFNNILTAIIGYGKMLEMKMNNEDPRKAYVTQILSASERAANLTHNLLAFSRKKAIELKAVSINMIINSVGKLLKSLLTEDIELQIITSDADMVVMVDITQIEQILLNLVANARDAMPKGGKLTIKVNEIELGNAFTKHHGYGDPGPYTLISITDTGLGMDARTKEKIFEPFFTTKDVGKGTGLGLAIVYGIIKQHRGYITVYSEPQMGTVFHMYLPIVKIGIEEAQPQSLLAKGGTETILIAEDDGHVRGITTEVFEHAGYKVIEAVDGQDVVEKFAEYQDMVNLLVLDVVMPRKNGKEAYEEIKKIKPDVKVIFSSGYTGDIIIDKGILEKEYDFIQKPAPPNDLLLKVREVLDRPRK
jgi:two-component system cell cycle sensor histidine kinase/response regulator CckA